MFENFVFGAQPQPMYDFEVSISPTDNTMSCPSSESMTTSYCAFSDPAIDGIICGFERQSLSRDDMEERFAIWRQTASCPLEVDDEDLMSPTSTSSEAPLPSHFISRSSIQCKRLQRQLNLIMQCSSSHVRDISALVEDMISSSSQCQILRPVPRHAISSGGPTPLPSRPRAGLAVFTEQTSIDAGFVPTGDEGFFDAETEECNEVSMRKACTPRGIRKGYAAVQWSRSADTGCRTKVNRKPRMRKRKTA